MNKLPSKADVGKGLKRVHIKRVAKVTVKKAGQTGTSASEKVILGIMNVLGMPKTEREEARQLLEAILIQDDDEVTGTRNLFLP